MLLATSETVPSSEQGVLLRDNPRFSLTHSYFGFSGLPSPTSAFQLQDLHIGLVSLACDPPGFSGTPADIERP
jgi:hypothetical protein